MVNWSGACPYCKSVFDIDWPDFATVLVVCLKCGKYFKLRPPPPAMRRLFKRYTKRGEIK